VSSSSGEACCELLYPVTYLLTYLLTLKMCLTSFHNKSNKWSLTLKAQRNGEVQKKEGAITMLISQAFKSSRIFIVWRWWLQFATTNDRPDDSQQKTCSKQSSSPDCIASPSLTHSLINLLVVTIPCYSFGLCCRVSNQLQLQRVSLWQHCNLLCTFVQIRTIVNITGRSFVSRRWPDWTVFALCGVIAKFRYAI